MPDVNLPLPFDAYAGEEPFVFVSYAHKDGYLVYPEKRHYMILGFEFGLMVALIQGMNGLKI